MGMSSSELLVPFVGAIQASFSVLLTILFGVMAAQFNLLSTNAAKEVSRMTVRMFLPALLIFKVGSELQQGTVLRYVPILLWAIGHNVVSMALGVLATRVFKLPNWTTPALAFNNTTSLPLLLIQSLKQTGILSTILVDGDSASDAIDRAESYFLVNAMVSNSLTFALGPRLLKPSEEDAPDKDEDGEEQEDGDTDEESEGGESDMERGPDGFIDEETSLLPEQRVRDANRTERRGYRKGRKYWNRIPPWGQNLLDIIYQFANAPLIGALAGAFIGVIPPLHRIFFNESNEGGWLNASLTTSIKNIGDLFASTQIIVVGVKLSQSLRKMKRGEESGPVSKTSLLFVSIIRFFIWPVISIAIIYALVTKTRALDSDPMLWFSMMLMPIGPPAMILVALLDVNSSPETEKMAVAKFLTIMYGITPLICFAVVGSLKATEAAMK